MTERVVRLPRSLVDAMIAHARAEAPNEACGIVAGKANAATRFYATPNAERSPVRYAIPPEEILRITRELDARGEDLYAIFHSHPATEAYPSATDVRLAFYPDSYYIILSLRDPQRPELRAFTIRDGEIREYPIVIDETAVG